MSVSVRFGWSASHCWPVSGQEWTASRPSGDRCAAGLRCSSIDHRASSPHLSDLDQLHGSSSEPLEDRRALLSHGEQRTVPAPHQVGPQSRWRDGEFGSRLTAAFALLDRVTTGPASVVPADIERARSAGLSDTALSDALYVGFVFNTVNRLANAFGFGCETEADRIKLARSLDRIAYHVPSVLLRRSERWRPISSSLHGRKRNVVRSGIGTARTR
jgi:hypothetical protein